MAAPKAVFQYHGSCLCGSITVDLQLDHDLYATPHGHLCHCQNCRKASGGPSVMCLMLPTSAVRLSDPNNVLKIYHDRNTTSGRSVPRGFCSECGSPVGCVPTHLDERLSVIASALLDRVPAPVFECFTSSRLPWNKPAADADRQYQYIDQVFNHLPQLE